MSALPENDRIRGPLLATLGQTDFPSDFPVVRNEGIHVCVMRGTARLVYSLPQLQLISVTETGFTARLPVPCQAGDKVWVYSELPSDRPRSHMPNGAVRSQTLEDDAVQISASIQELRRDQQRAVTLPFGSTGYVDWSPGLGERFLTIGEDGAVQVRVRPQDFNGLTAAQRDGGNVLPENFRSALGVEAKVVKGGDTATAGVVAAIGYKWELNPFITSEGMGGLHPAGKAYYQYAFNRNFDSTNAPTAAESPAATVMSISTNTGSGCVAMAYMGISLIEVDGGKALGQNLIVGSSQALDGIKVEGLEIDIQPAFGSGVVDGFALCLNAFNVATPCSAILVGSVGGGSFANCLNVIGGVSETALCATNGATMKCLVHTGTGNYTEGAILIANGHMLRFSGPSSSYSRMYADGSNTLRMVLAGNLAIRSAADDVSIIGVDSTGTMAIGANASVERGRKLDVVTGITGEGTGIARFGSVSSDADAVDMFAVLGSAGNSAACALRVRANSATGRSINAGGTVNGAGADLAEYRKKNPDMLDGDRSFAKGDVVGFDANGELTDLWAEAVSFGVKSTAPYLVGNEQDLPAVTPPPAQPVLTLPMYEGVIDPGPSPARVKDESDDAFAARREAWATAVAAHEADAADHEAECEAARSLHETVAIPAWLAEYNAWMEAMDKARQPFDRIAYCGEVPVNITGASVGDFLVPEETDDGGITARATSPENMTLADSLSRLGRVRRILSDGRAEIVIHVG